MERRDIEMLGSMYASFARVDGVKALCASFKKYIQVRFFFGIDVSLIIPTRSA